ncbi:hypothetical protein NQZ68_008486 [Dissostichus eleginoides]|nr:hypothetical protein NQZ68_008486 [Dissostichus eleginoides]
MQTGTVSDQVKEESELGLLNDDDRNDDIAKQGTESEDDSVDEQMYKNGDRETETDTNSESEDDADTEQVENDERKTYIGTESEEEEDNYSEVVQGEIKSEKITQTGTDSEEEDDSEIEKFVDINDDREIQTGTESEESDSHVEQVEKKTVKVKQRGMESEEDEDSEVEQGKDDEESERTIESDESTMKVKEETSRYRKIPPMPKHVHPNVHQSLDFLQQLIAKGNNPTLENGDIDSESQSGWEEEEQKRAHTIVGRSPYTQCFQEEFQEAQAAIGEAEEDEDGHQPNRYHCPKILKVLLGNYMGIFPLWSGAMLGDLRRYARDKTLDPDTSEVQTRDTNCHTKTLWEQGQTELVVSVIKSQDQCVTLRHSEFMTLRPEELICGEVNLDTFDAAVSFVNVNNNHWRFLMAKEAIQSFPVIPSFNMKNSPRDMCRLWEEMAEELLSTSEKDYCSMCGLKEVPRDKDIEAVVIDWVGA